MSGLLKKIEVVANLSIVVVAIVVCIAAVKYFQTEATGSGASTANIAAG